jgi:hypothetical protein
MPVFDVEAYLDSAGVSRRMLRFGPRVVSFAQGAAASSHMLARNIRIEEDLVDQLFNSSEKRLARTLLLAR